MKNTTFPIGTIVDINQEKAVIVGYTSVEKENHLRNAYVVLPYPQGYSSGQSLRIAEKEDITLIAKGYESEQSKYLTDYIDKTGEIAEKLSVEEMKNAWMSIMEEE